MTKILFLLFQALMITVCCSSIKSKSLRKLPQQGIEGYVYRVSGNQMPSPDRKLSPPKGIKTTLYIFELTNLGQVIRQGQSAFYLSIKTKLISKIQTDTNGYFKISTEQGRYSLFTKKNELFFANWFDKDNNIAPAEVLQGKMTKVEFTVDYDAVY
jgi:hypothetical protein